MASSSGDLAIIIITLFLIFLQVASLFAGIGLQDLSGRLRTLAHWSHTQLKLWTGARERQPLDLISQHVLSMMTHRREERMKAFCFSLSHVVTVALALALFHRMSGVDRWMTMSQDVILVVLMLILITANTLPNCISGNSVHCLFGLFTLVLVLWVPSGNDFPEAIMVSCMSAWLVRLALSMICLDVRMAALLNILCCITDSLHYAGIWSDNNSLLTPRTLIFFDTASVLYILLLAWGFQGVTYAEVRQEIEGQARKIEQSAVMMLLDMVCDVVLSMDSSLLISDHSPRFAAMLMLEATRSLQGLEFANFISSEEDQSRFRSCLLHNSFDMEFASRALNVNIRDSNGTSFNVEILCVPFQGLDNSTHFMIGIREITDLQPEPLRSLSAIAEPHPKANPGRQTSAHGTPSITNGTSPVLQPNCLVAGDGGVTRPGSANSAPVNLESEDSDIQSSIGSQSSRNMQLALPKLKETSFKAKQITMCEMLASWNVEIPRRSCCAFHAYQHELRVVLRRSRGSRCIHNLLREDSWSCPSCGILNNFDEEENACAICGQEIQFAALAL